MLGHNIIEEVRWFLRLMIDKRLTFVLDSVAKKTTLGSVAISGICILRSLSNYSNLSTMLTDCFWTWTSSLEIQNHIIEWFISYASETVLYNAKTKTKKRKKAIPAYDRYKQI